MNKIVKGLIGVFATIMLLVLGLFLYLKSGHTGPSNEVWTSFIGRDTTVGILPDQYANYFTYTAAITSDDIGFRVKGRFPESRYFSFNVYSLGDNETQGSLVDYQIISDSGKPNHFVANPDSVDIGEEYTVHIVPDKFSDLELKNKLIYRNDVKLLLIVIRLYDYDKDDYGGVGYPTVEAIKIKASDIISTRAPRPLSLRSIVRTFSLPKMVDRLANLYRAENQTLLDGPDQLYTLPFHAIDDSGFIENNDNRYLMTGITKDENEVFVFRFKAPSFTTGPDDIHHSDVRYWSFNLGNAATYNFNAIKDEDAIVDDDGYVHIVLADADTELESRVTQLGYNFMEWNMPWQKGFILFRHMLANPQFEAQIDEIPEFVASTIDHESIEAQLYIGDYAPKGLRMTREAFLEKYQVIK